MEGAPWKFKNYEFIKFSKRRPIFWLVFLVYMGGCLMYRMAQKRQKAGGGEAPSWSVLTSTEAMRSDAMVFSDVPLQYVEEIWGNSGFLNAILNLMFLGFGIINK